MAQTANRALLKVIAADEGIILDEWMKKVLVGSTSSAGNVNARAAASSLLKGLQVALMEGRFDGIQGPEWQEPKQILAELSAARAREGATPRETATFVFGLKQALFTRAADVLSNEPAALAEETLLVSNLLDELGLYTIEVFQKSREEVIERQREEMLELSTPVVKLWDQIIALPLIGTLDSARTQVVMENLLGEIVASGASIAIIDITGVPTVDTLVAQHLLKTVAAARLMGAECLISGIRPQIAQTIVHLGVDLDGVITKASLADAFVVALGKMNASIVKNTAKK